MVKERNAYMHVWNPQLEQHLENFESNNNDDEKQDSLDITASSSDGATTDTVASPKGESEATEVDRGSPRMNQVIDFLSKPNMEWIFGVGLLTSWCVANGFVSPWNAVVSVLCLVAAPCLLWYNKRLDQQREQKNILQYQSCRIKLASLLGSIGAPLLAINNDANSNTGATSAIDNEFLVKFCSSHVSLLKQVDDSLEMLRTAVSMSLRSTTRSVERVELATLHKSKTNSSVTLSTARQWLARVLVNEYSILRELLPLDDTGAGGEETSVVEAPEVLTLAWLKALRIEVAELLSFQVSQLVSSPAMWCDVSDDTSKLRRQMGASIMAAQESTEYLRLMFDVSQMPMQENDALQQVSNQFEKASIALWACQASRNDEQGVLEFLEHLETLLHSVGNVRERQLAKGNTEDQHSNDPDAMESSTDASSTLNQAVDSGDFVHSGTSIHDGASHRPSVNRGVDNKKTVVFTASVSATRQSDANKHDLDPATIENVASQGIVLQELQKRLAQLDPVEEVDPTGNDVKDDLMESLEHRQGKPTASSSPMFLDVSGDLLSELKTSIGNQSDCLGDADS